MWRVAKKATRGSAEGRCRPTRTSTKAGAHEWRGSFGRRNHRRSGPLTALTRHGLDEEGEPRRSAPRPPRSAPRRRYPALLQQRTPSGSARGTAYPTTATPGSIPATPAEHVERHTDVIKHRAQGHRRATATDRPFRVQHLAALHHLPACSAPSGWQQPPIVPHPVRNAASLAISTPSPPTHAWRYSISGKGSVSIAFTAEIRCRCWPSAAIPPGRSWVMSSMRKMRRRESSPRAAAAAPSAAAFAAARPAIVCARARAAAAIVAAAGSGSGGGGVGSFASSAYAVLSRSFRWRRTLAAPRRPHPSLEPTTARQGRGGATLPPASCRPPARSAPTRTMPPPRPIAPPSPPPPPPTTTTRPPRLRRSGVRCPPSPCPAARGAGAPPPSAAGGAAAAAAWAERSARPTSAERILAGGRATERARRR